MPYSARPSRRRRALSLPLFGLSLLPLLGPSGALAGGAAAAAPVLPTGGRVAAGSAVVGGVVAGAGGRGLGGASLTVSQSSSKAILDWTGFSIGSGGTVRFDNGSGATLNRVTGTSLSSIQGLLSATGSVYLINPNGVIIGRSGVVDVGGRFVASTLDVADGDFLAGGALSFTGPSTASVVNLGRVGALGGDVALVGARVENDGTITAVAGEGALIAGSRVLMRDASLDGGRFAVLAGGSATSATNRGTIQAADAELRAEGGSVYALAGDTSGVERASGIQVQGTTAGQGRVWLVADGGTLEVSGQVVAQGVGGTAGAIETSGGTVKLGQARIDAHGGVWTVDPYDLTIDATAAASLSASLNAGTSVVEQTTAGGTSGAGVADASGSGDIYVAAPISWSTPAALTLSAYRDIDLEAPITASGAGALTLITDNSGAGNGGAFNALGGSVRFTGGGAQPSGSLRIGVGTATPVAYTLVADLATLSADIAANNSGAYALARPIDAGQTSYSTIPLASTETTAFAGRLEGLGNTISNLTLNDSTDTYVGLFGLIAATGVVRDLSLANVAVTGGDEANVGALVGFNSGSLTGVQVQGAVAGGVGASVGGLAGATDGAILAALATTTVSATGGDVGGVAGSNYSGGAITIGVARSVVSGGDDGAVGGLVGYNDGAISGSHAGGAVTGGAGAIAGGLVGLNDSTIQTSYATAPVVAQGTDATGAPSQVGGLVGANIVGGAITNSYASGPATGGAGASVGGLVGYNAASVTASYALGAASGGDQGDVGGLVGYDDAGAAVSQAYATGLVSGGSGAVLGGVAGYADPTATMSAVVYDLQTTGQAVGVGSGAQTGVAGLTTAQFMTASNLGGFSFGGLGSGASWVIVDADGSIDNAGGAAGATRPLLLSEYSTIVDDAHQLQLIALNLSATYWLAADVDAGATSQAAEVWGYGSGGFAPIGSAATPFTGQLNGRGHVISGLAIARAGAGDVGLFGVTAPSASISDLTLAGGQIQGGADVGALVGLNAGEITGVTSLSSVSGSSAVGGLVGENDGLVQASVAAAPVSGTTATGGLVGLNDAPGQITASYATGAVVASSGKASAAGGLVGRNAGTLTSDLATGAVAGTADVGGLVGANSGAVASSYATGAVSAGSGKGASAGEAVGGLAGLNTGALSADDATGAVSGLGQLGGLVGVNQGSVQASYATGAVRGASGKVADVGGLVGDNAGQIANAYATGAISGSSGKGSLVGLNEASGTIAAAYATGLAHGGAGLVGVNDGVVSQSYFDEATTGTTTGVGSGQITGAAGIGAATGLDPYAQATYQGFDFTSIWTLEPGATRPDLLANPQTPPPS